MKRMIKIILLFSICFSFWYCSSKVLPPTTAQYNEVKKNNPDADTTVIFNGYQVFSANCHKCHGLKNPGNYTAEKWDKILPVMSKRAKLTKEQNELVRTYVMAFSKKETAVN